jgi:aromatic-amino-acid transaminase
MVGEHVLSSSAQAKEGSDTIFTWWARYQNAKAAGADAVNGTIGALLEDDGSLAINKVVDAAVRSAPEVEISAYAPLAGLPSFLDLSMTLAMGQSRWDLHNAGFHFSSTATPGGSGALYLAANNLLERGQTILLRDRHWGPYQGFLINNGLDWTTWPLLAQDGNEIHPYFARPEFETQLADLVTKQDKIMVWLNDPAHNPTGLSMGPNGRAACLEAFVDSALLNENVGHTLLIDSAYSLYAAEPHGWAETIVEAVNNGMMWPENMMICFSVSLSKSHTIYGLRTGALVCVHPQEEVAERMNTVMSVTGRQTWSAAPRIAQYCVSEMHASEEGGAAWAEERDRLKYLLDQRRKNLIEACERHEVPLNPTMDGFFAWLEAEDPVAIAEACAQENVFLVPLTGGVRIGLCAVNSKQMDQVASALAKAIR